MCVMLQNRKLEKRNSSTSRRPPVTHTYRAMTWLNYAYMLGQSARARLGMGEPHVTGESNAKDRPSRPALHHLKRHDFTIHGSPLTPCSCYHPNHEIHAAEAGRLPMKQDLLRMTSVCTYYGEGSGDAMIAIRHPCTRYTWCDGFPPMQRCDSLNCSYCSRSQGFPENLRTSLRTGVLRFSCTQLGPVR